MKASGASAAGLILATGQFHIANLYTLTPAVASFSALRFTTWDVPLTVGANTYLTNLHIRRGPLTQKVGVEVQSLELELTPQSDGDAITVGGVPFLQACRLGFLDGCKLEWHKVFMATPGDVSAGAVLWFQGRLGTVEPGRLTARTSVESDLALLNIAMPRHLIQTGCAHRLFDSGCTLNPATYQASSSVLSVDVNRTYITTGLSNPNDYWSLGTLTFTSGPLNGLSLTVKKSLLASGQITFVRQLPLAPAVGNTFTILPGCDKKKTTCDAKFNNLLHFRGFPYVPVPETMYGGTTIKSRGEPAGGQGRRPTVGSTASGSRRGR